MSRRTRRTIRIAAARAVSTSVGSRYLTEALEQRVLLSDSSAVQLFGTTPAVFVQNKGQWTDQSVRFAYQGDGASIGMTNSGAYFRLFKPDPNSVEAAVSAALDEAAGTAAPTVTSTAFSIHFDGTKRTRPVGQDATPSVFNYYVGDKSQWRTNVPGFESITYPNLYNGIDLTTSGIQKSSLKYEFRVDPHANYRKIKLSYAGINGLSIDSQGRLHIATDLGEVIDDAPIAYQMIKGCKVEVAARYELVDGDTYRFRITGKYDRSQTLVIDPNLDWSSYLGGADYDAGIAIAIDLSGDFWVGGVTWSHGWTSGGFDTSFNGGSSDAFVAKINANGSLAWSSYLGGASDDFGYGIATDSSGNAWVTGETSSSGWTSGGFDTSYNGGNTDAFVAKINANGSLAWSSYLGGANNERGNGIATDPSGNAWVTGWTSSSDFASGGFDTSYNGGGDDAFVAKINFNGSLAWSSYMGGTNFDFGHGVATDPSGNAWVTGWTSSSDFASGGFDTSYNGGTYDAFVTKINANGSLAWSSYLGGASKDFGYGIATDSSGNAWVTGETDSSGWASGGFDTSYNGSGIYGYGDAFVAKIHANGSLAWSSYLGGTSDDFGHGIATDSSGNAWVTGTTSSSNFASGGFDTSYNGGNSDAFVAKINANGSLVWSSYMGGMDWDDGYGITTDRSGNSWVTGRTSLSYYNWISGGFDTSYNGGNYDAFVAKISEPPSVDTAQFLYDSAQQLQFQFNRRVYFTTLDVLNLTTGQTISSYLFSGQQVNNNTAVIWTYTGGILPEGNYRATLPAGAISDLDGKPMTADYTFNFFVLGGDANHDAKVDVRDLLTLATNWQGNGKVFSQGDFNYDGKVDVADLTILARNWQKTADGTVLSSAPMPAILPQQTPPPVLVRPPTRTAFKVVSLIV